MSLVHAGHRSLRPWAYGRGRVGGTCPKLRETGRTRRVDQAVGDQVPPVLLPLSRPHDGFSGEWRGGRIPSLPVERPSHLRVCIDARVDAWVCVGLWWSRRVVGHVRRRLAHVIHGVRREVVARLAWMRLRLPRSQQDD